MTAPVCRPVLTQPSWPPACCACRIHRAPCRGATHCTYAARVLASGVPHVLRSPWRPSCVHHGTPGAVGQIHSRIGISQPAEVFDSDTDLLALLAALSAREEIACVFVDEAQFLSKQQVGLA